MEKDYTLLVGSIKNYVDWATYLQNNKVSPDRQINNLTVDFSKTSFLEPFHLVSLACLIEEYYQYNAKISFIPGGYALNKYLINIKFYNYWEEGFDRTAFTLTHIDTNLCLWKVSNELIDSYANQAQAYFEKNFFDGKSLEALSISLKEIFNNIYDHAKSSVDGYVLTQFYPNKGEIVTSVCDLGVGIPYKINEVWTSSNKEKLSEDNALRAAFMQKVSSKSTPRNRGLGLPNLLSNVKTLQGNLHVYSNNAFFNHSPSKGLHIYYTNQKFPGTLLNINLKTEHLPQIEEEVDDAEFLF